MKRRGSLACLLASTCLALLMAEGLARHFFKSRLHLRLSERNTFYQYDAGLGWFPVPHRSGDYKGARTFSIVQNGAGFRDREHAATPLPRMVFLGDSFVYGYNVEAADRFTERLQARLSSWDIFNCGISGYGTDQEFLLLQRFWPELHPDVVCLVFCTENDPDDNSFNRRYGGYFKPYFIRKESKLILQGVPVPKSINFYFSHAPWLFKSAFLAELAQAVVRWRQPPILKVADPTEVILEAMKTFVEEHHARFVIGFTLPSSTLQTFCIKTQTPCIDLSTPYRDKDEVGHWTAQGHQIVAEKLFQFFRKDERP